MIARAPVVADAFVPIDDQRVDAKLMKARRNGKSGLPAPDDDHGGVTFGECALFLQTIGPVLRAEIACRIGLATPSEFVFVASEFLQIGAQGPGAQLALAIGFQPQHPRTGTEGTFEFEQRFDIFIAGAGYPARRRSLVWYMKVSRLRARQRLTQGRFDRGPVGHRLDVPGESQDVPPEAVIQEQSGGCRGVACR